MVEQLWVAICSYAITQLKIPIHYRPTPAPIDHSQLYSGYTRQQISRKFTQNKRKYRISYESGFQRFQSLIPHHFCFLIRIATTTRRLGAHSSLLGFRYAGVLLGGHNFFPMKLSGNPIRNSAKKKKPLIKRTHFPTIFTFSFAFFYIYEKFNASV